MFQSLASPERNPAAIMLHSLRRYVEFLKAFGFCNLSPPSWERGKAAIDKNFRGHPADLESTDLQLVLESPRDA
jgi:hypothetical protein